MKNLPKQTDRERAAMWFARIASAPNLLRAKQALRESRKNDPPGGECYESEKAFREVCHWRDWPGNSAQYLIGK